MQKIESQLSEHQECLIRLTLKKDDQMGISQIYHNQSLELKIKNSLIEGARIRHPESGKTTELRVVNRLHSPLEIILEDTHGMMRMILKPSANHSHFEAVLNHPTNRYLLNIH